MSLLLMEKYCEVYCDRNFWSLRFSQADVAPPSAARPAQSHLRGKYRSTPGLRVSQDRRYSESRETTIRVREGWLGSVVSGCRSSASLLPPLETQLHRAFPQGAD